MSLVDRLERMRGVAEAEGIYFNPPLQPATILERLARFEMEIPNEISALFQVCDGAEIGGCVSIISLDIYISMKNYLGELAAETEDEEWAREYFPFAQFNSELTLCYAFEDPGVYTLDIECSYIVKVAPSLELFVSALESALVGEGLRRDTDGSPFLPSWCGEAKKYGVNDVWNTGGQ